MSETETKSQAVYTVSETKTNSVYIEILMGMVQVFFQMYWKLIKPGCSHPKAREVAGLVCGSGRVELGCGEMWCSTNHQMAPGHSLVVYYSLVISVIIAMHWGPQGMSAIIGYYNCA